MTATFVADNRHELLPYQGMDEPLDLPLTEACELGKLADRRPTQTLVRSVIA
jgi:hypothetical protein